MKHLVIIAAALVLLSSCTRDVPVVPAFAPPATAAAVVPTEAPDPTVEPPPPPLDKIDLVAILTDVSALPKGFTAGKIDAKAPDYKGAAPRPAPINAATLSIVHGKDPAGTVVIWLYDDGTKTNDSYTTQKGLLTLLSQQSGDPVESVPDLGKQAMVMTATVGPPGTFLEFLRCRAVVDIHLTGDIIDSKNTVAYAKDLDSRLTPLICQ